MCVNAGAEHVYAVELLEDAAAAASQLIHQLGLSDRITVIQGDIRRIDLERCVDVCVQGIVGNIGSADGIIPIWNSAQRLFAPDCLAIPLRCSTYIAAVELPETLRTAPRFNSLARQYLDRLFSEKGSEFDVRLCVRNFPGSGLISERHLFHFLQFAYVSEVFAVVRMATGLLAMIGSSTHRLVGLIQHTCNCPHRRGPLVGLTDSPS